MRGSAQIVGLKVLVHQDVRELLEAGVASSWRMTAKLPWKLQKRRNQ